MIITVYSHGYDSGKLGELQRDLEKHFNMGSSLKEFIEYLENKYKVRLADEHAKLYEISELFQTRVKNILERIEIKIIREAYNNNTVEETEN